MAINPADIDAIPEYTDAQILKATRLAITQITLTGVSRGINGRSLTTANLADLWQQVRDLESRVAAGDGTGSIAVVSFNDPL
jgi:hypothetical protein